MILRIWVFLLLFFQFAHSMPVTYAIGVSTEAEYLKKLLAQISQIIEEEDSIIVQVDVGNTTTEVENVIKSYKSKMPKLKVIKFKLEGNFADFRNNMIKHAAKKGYMFQLDADEYLGVDLARNLKWFISLYPEADVIRVPRANYYIDKYNNEEEEKKLKLIKKELDEYGRFVYPDFQQRIFNLANKDIKYQGKVHEQILGDFKEVRMPHYKGLSFELIHIKTISKQMTSDSLYDQIMNSK